jgi:hypothetical protein
MHRQLRGRPCALIRKIIPRHHLAMEYFTIPPGKEGFVETT